MLSTVSATDPSNLMRTAYLSELIGMAWKHIPPAVPVNLAIPVDGEDNIFEVVPTDMIFANDSTYVVGWTVLNEKFEFAIRELPQRPEEVFWAPVHAFAAFVASVSAVAISATKSLNPSPRCLSLIFPCSSTPIPAGFVIESPLSSWITSGIITTPPVPLIDPEVTVSPRKTVVPGTPVPVAKGIPSK